MLFAVCSISIICLILKKKERLYPCFTEAPLCARLYKRRAVLKLSTALQVVTAWNGLAIGAFANASRVLANEPQPSTPLFPVEGRPAKDYLTGASLLRCLCSSRLVMRKSNEVTVAPHVAQYIICSPRAAEVQQARVALVALIMANFGANPANGMGFHSLF